MWKPPAEHEQQKAGMNLCRNSRLRTLALILPFLVLACVLVSREPLPGRPSHHADGGFRNPNPAFTRPGGWVRAKYVVGRVWVNLVASRSLFVPRGANDGYALRENNGDATVTWIGHSTLLVQLDGINLLTDPHWGDRAGPLSWLGARRLNAPGMRFEDLPPIDLVLISHDHYDHLDLGTVKRLAGAHNPLFLVPLGVKAWFAENGMAHVEELDWWQTYEYRGLRLVCVPAQHFSGRNFSDTNRRLWASWVVAGRSKRLYVGGDSGYFDGFKQIGGALGPFDLAAVPIGAYKPAYMMKSVHTTPEEAVQAFKDLRGRSLLGIHWGTFELAEEPLDEPPERMLKEARQRKINLEHVWVLKRGETRHW